MKNGKLKQELADIRDTASVTVGIGEKQYPITAVEDNGGVVLRTEVQLGRPRKYKTDAERVAGYRARFAKANRKRRAKK
jgi:hypothetical protein